MNCKLLSPNLGFLQIVTSFVQGLMTGAREGSGFVAGFVKELVFSGGVSSNID